MHRLRALLFDLDGTLIDSAEASNAAYARALLEFGVRIAPDEVARAAAGRHWQHFLPGILSRAGVECDPAAVARRKGELYRESLDKLRVNFALLSLAASVGPEMQTVLVTTASGESVGAILRRFDLGHAFDLVITGDEVARHKPDPEAYLLALARLRLEPAKCLAFEDSDVGVASAEAAGIPVVRVTFNA